MNRRHVFKMLGAAAASCSLAALAGGRARRQALAGGRARRQALAGEGAAERTGIRDKMPVIFLAHGSPFTLVDDQWMRELAAWALALPQPKAILILSAHWQARPLTVGATTRVPLLYDFSGFPLEFYRLQYPAPGAPALAGRVRDLLSPTQPIASDPRRGLDHGAYVPLIAMYPNADVPVLQVSIPTLDPKSLFDLGRALEPLRREGVLIVGSGFLTHNLRALDLRPNAPVPSWAAEFDAWVADVLARKDVDALLDYRSRAPGVNLALPTHEHFAPVLTAMGAAGGAGDAPRFAITGMVGGTLTKRSVQFG